MAHNKDYIPDRESEFDGWFANLVQYVTGKTGGNRPEWGFIPSEKAADLQTRYNEWHDAYTKTLGPHTSVDTEAKQDQRKKAEASIRPFVQQFLKFEPVTDEDRTAMNLPSRDNTKSAIGVPESRPVIGGLRDLGGFRIEIPFHDEATPESKKRPYGCNGCLLVYTVGETKTTEYAQLRTTKLMTHSPFMLQLEPEAEGKYFSCACRWQNETGEVGPWSEIHHIVVS